MPLKLEPVGPKEGAETLSVPRCEVISKAWHAVSFIEEMREDMKKVRQSAARDMALGAFAEAITHLVVGAMLLVPSGLAEQVPQLESAIPREAP